MRSIRPGRQRLEMDELYIAHMLKCPRCLKEFKYVFELDQHLLSKHKLPRDIREIIFKNMGVIWFQNYAPPGRWKGWWI